MKETSFKGHPQNIGQLTLVGVGPGDPALLTIAAVKAIQDSTIIAFPVSNHNASSLAEEIASEWISETKKKIPLVFPMVADVDQRQIAWREASHQLVREVSNGEQVAFLCQGDVSLFASSSYVMLDITLNYPECPLQIIPGINSFSAAAAIAQLPLALQQEQLLIMPTPDDCQTLEALIEEAASLGRVLILLKLGKRWHWVRGLLERMNLLEKAVFAQRVGFSDQKIIKSVALDENEVPYFSLLIIRQNWPEVLPLPWNN